MPEPSVRRGRAFAPAHVSGIFVPRLSARDPRGRGSLGAGLVLSVGVTASVTWRPARRSRVRLGADRPGRFEISRGVATRLLAARPGALEVRLRHDLPIGQGFGSSAAGALATGLAVAQALSVPRRRAIEVAHLADLFGGGGLGGVAAILGGGLETRLRPGVPPYGVVRRRPVAAPIFVGVVGPPLRSPTLLGGAGPGERFAVGEPLFAGFAGRPSWDRFWDVAERFTDDVALAPPRLQRLLAELRQRGARAAQAMFGRSFFATVPGPRDRAELSRWLGREGVTFWSVHVGDRGASVVRPGP